MCDDIFSKPFKSSLGKDAVYNFISSIIKESKYYCDDVVIKHFIKVPVMTKKDSDDFENSTECWICDNAYINSDVKVRDQCHTTGKYRVSAHRYCNINVKVNHKIVIEFQNLQNCVSHIMQEVGKFNLKCHIKWIGKCMSFRINNKFSFIDSFQFLISLLDSLVKNLGKDDFKYFSQEFDNNVLDLVKRKGFYPYEKYMSDFGKFKEQLPSKEKLYSLLTGKEVSGKEHEYVLKVWDKFEMKTMKDYHNL